MPPTIETGATGLKRTFVPQFAKLPVYATVAALPEPFLPSMSGPQASLYGAVGAFIGMFFANEKPFESAAHISIAIKGFKVLFTVHSQGVAFFGM